MYRISKQFHFSAAHQLDLLPEGHPCKRLHGHNYIVEIVLEAEKLDERYFVADYHELTPVKTFRDEHLDLDALRKQMKLAPLILGLLGNFAELFRKCEAELQARGDYHRANRLVVTAYGDSLARGLQEGREALWWLAWPPAYRETIESALPEEAAIEPELVWAIMREESHYRVDARSSVGALGLLQLMPRTARQLAEERGIEGFESEDLFDPETNIALGAAYLDQLANRFDGRLSAAIGSYNAGPRRVSSWLRGEAQKLPDDVWVEGIPYDQTRAYVKRVLRSLHVYQSFYR